MPFRMAGRHGPLWVRASPRLIRDEETGAWQGGTGIPADITDPVEKSEGLEITKGGIQETHSESVEDPGRRLCEQLQDIFSGLQPLMDEGMGCARGVALLRQGYEMLSALVVAVRASLVPEGKAERSASGFDSETPKRVNQKILADTLARISHTEVVQMRRNARAEQGARRAHPRSGL